MNLLYLQPSRVAYLTGRKSVGYGIYLQRNFAVDTFCNSKSIVIFGDEFVIFAKCGYFYFSEIFLLHFSNFSSLIHEIGNKSIPTMSRNFADEKLCGTFQQD
jgi:hypothetical protein